MLNFRSFQFPSFSAFVAAAFHDDEEFLASCVAEEAALKGGGAEYTFVKRLFKQFFDKKITSVVDVVSCAVLADQLTYADMIQPMRTFKAYYLCLNDTHQRILAQEMDNRVRLMTPATDACDYIELRSLSNLVKFWMHGYHREIIDFNGKTLFLGELAPYIYDNTHARDLPENEQLLYSVLGMWLSPQDKYDSLQDIFGAEGHDNPEGFQALKKAATEQYRQELKAARQ